MGGAEVFINQLLTWFKTKNVPVKAWTTYKPQIRNLNKLGIRTKRIPIVFDIIGDWKGFIKGVILLPFAFFYYGYLTYINKNSGTLLMSGFEKLLVTPWAKIFNVPVVWIEFGPLETVLSKFFGFPGLIYRLVSKLPDYVIESSQNTHKYNIGVTGFDSKKVKVIPCGISPLKLYKSPAKKFTAYCVSRMESGKGQDLLIKAWPKVLKRFSKAKLYFVGEGDFKSVLQKQVAQMKLTKSIYFLGWVDNLVKEISPLTVGVFPSVWNLEGFGMILIEAMSLGKPVICFKSGPYPEIVDSKCALLVKKGSIDGLSKAIIKIFSDPPSAKRLGENGRRRFNKIFAIDKVGQSYAKILLDAQNKHVNYTSTN